MMTQLSNGGYKVTPTIFKSDKPKIIEERLISDPDDLKIIMDALFLQLTNSVEHLIDLELRETFVCW